MSHNSMDISFSREDDRNELGVPGVHILVKGIEQSTGHYKIDASVVQGKTRYLVDAAKMIDLKAPDGTLYPTDERPHPNVFKYVKLEGIRQTAPLHKRISWPWPVPTKQDQFDFPDRFQPTQFSLDPEEELLQSVEELKFLGYRLEDIIELIGNSYPEEPIAINMDWGDKLWNN